MFWRALTNFPLSCFILLGIFFPKLTLAAPEFLTYPFNQEQRLMQGWNYNSINRTHQGLDYYTPVGNKLVATLDGSLKSYFQPGANFVYGKFIILDHENGYKSLYAHLNSVEIKTRLKRGETIGTSGSSGTDNPHLHFEVLATVRTIGANRGYGWRVDPYDLYSTSEYYPPNKYYKKLGPKQLWLNEYPTIVASHLPSVLSSVNESNSAKLSWTKSEDSSFDSYELFRSTSPNGTLDPGKRTSVFSTKDSNILSFFDNNKNPGTYYYRLTTNYKDGQKTESEEVSTTINREYQRITTDGGIQQGPVLAGKRLVWEDLRNENNTFPKKLFYYDMETKKLEEVGIGVEGAKRPLDPDATSNQVVFTAQDNSFNSTAMNIYCYDFEEKTAFPITKASADQLDPVINEDGIVIWTDMRNGNADLYYLDLKKSEGEKPFVAEKGVQSAAKVSGNNVVWRDSRSGNTDLYYKKLNESGETVLATNIGLGGGNDIWKNWVIWISKKKLFLMNLETKETKILQENNALVAVINEGKVAYSASEGTSIYIHVYDIASGQTTKLDRKVISTGQLAVNESYVAFDDIVEENRDIFLTAI